MSSRFLPAPTSEVAGAQRHRPPPRTIPDWRRPLAEVVGSARIHGSGTATGVVIGDVGAPGGEAAPADVAIYDENASTGCRSC